MKQYKIKTIILYTQRFNSFDLPIPYCAYHKCNIPCKYPVSLNNSIEAKQKGPDIYIYIDHTKQIYIKSKI